ncbi:MAG: hypothetical protein ACK5DE_02205 [Bacteroidota bacterium]|jgi:hypothetical protein
MELSVQNLDQIVNPIELIHLLGEELHVGLNGEYTTNCPKCESKLFILDKEFVCENSLCTYRAGSAVDYLVAKGICTWDSAIETLNNILSDKLKNSVIYKNQKLVTGQLKSKRRVFDFFLKNALNGAHNNINIIQYRSALRAQGLDPDALKHSVFVLNAQEVEKLKELVKSINPDKNLNISGVHIALPYFVNYHTISHLLVLKTPDSKPEKINILPSRTAFFSLLQRHPACKKTKLAYTYAEAAKLNTQYSRVNPEMLCLHMMVDATASGESFVLPSATYIASGDSHSDLRVAGTIQRYVPDLKVSENKVALHSEYEPIPADEFILKCVVKELKKNIPISNILPLVELNHRSRQALLEQLHANRYFAEADEVRNFFKTLPVFKDDKVTLFSNPYGYSLKKHSNDTYTNNISNFTIELEQNIVFTESTDIFHAGNLLFNNGKYPIILRQEEIDKISELEKAARRATMGVTTADINIPTVMERSGAKYLTTYLREQVSQLGKTEGIPMLGWSPRRSSFYAPYFISDRKGSRVGKKYLHPIIPTLSSFTTDISDVSALHHDLPEVIVNILNQAAAFIVRTFLSMQIRPLSIYNNSEGRRLLSEMFSALGQTTLLQLNQNMRGEEIPGLRGFPFYAVGYSSSQINKSSLSAFILCDTGTAINENFSLDIIHKAQTTLKFIVRKIAEWALQTEAENFKQQHSVSRANAYSKEGAQIIIDSCGLLSWPSSKTPFENLDGLLGSIGFEEVKNYFISNINTHKLQIKNEILNRVPNIEGFESELRSISKHVDFTKDTVDVDSESMLEALNSYYHMSPTLTEYFDSSKLLNH